MELQSIVRSYVHAFPEDVHGLRQLLQQVQHQEHLNDRKNFTGHVTAGGIVLSPDGSNVLLVRHKFLDKWLQPGGHWEPGDASPLETARREVTEETGVSELAYHPFKPSLPQVPLQISTHRIPPNPAKDEPEHYHYDFRYVFTAVPAVLSPQLQEVSAARWFARTAAETAELVTELARSHAVLGI